MPASARRRTALRTATALGGALALAPTFALAAPSGTVGADITGAYRLVFVTTDSTAASSTAISTYNSFVNTEAGLAGSLLPSSSWAVIGSTASVNAVTNANALCGGNSSCINAPLYEVVLNTTTNSLSDVLVANSIAAMFAGTISSDINAIQSGITSGGFVFTGTNDNGTTATGNELGASSVATGNVTPPGFTPSEIGTFNNAIFANFGAKSVYGISGLLQGTGTSNVPEPASAALLGVGAGLMLVMRRRRKAG